ncbi:MAG: DUF3237 domain-containing protein [Nannocystis sp.]|nr:DUF3237 domain-containing protein [Nannocystis sp.]MBA3546949.1 DUF3237 domain-containing protein [Nannocystis sp.]
MAIELVPLGNLTFQLGTQSLLRTTPSGMRLISELSAVEWTGERLRGQLRGAAAADWLIIGADGIATLDIRFVLATDDGAILYVHGPGRSDASKGAGSAPSYFVPYIETDDPRYAWLNRTQLIAKGQLTGTTVAFEVFEVR